MQQIIYISEQDVLCGRGGGTLRHSGNKKYRSLIRTSKPVYLVSSKGEKTAISRSIVAAIRKISGRFLERSKDQESWYDIGDAKATEKTSQALREGQPKLRKKMIDHGLIANTSFHSTCSTGSMISLLAPATQIDPNPVFGNASWSSVDKKDKGEFDRKSSMLGRSLNILFTDIEPVTGDQRPHVIGNCRFHPTDGPANTNESRFHKHQSRTVTPPTTPPLHPQHPIDRSGINNDIFPCPFSCEDYGSNMDLDMAVPNSANDFDDSNSISTFYMDEDEMIDDDDDDDHPMFRTTTVPPPPLTNHVRALTELKDNVPIYDNDDDQPIFPPSAHRSPIANHLLALTELKDHVPIYPSIYSLLQNTGSNHDCNNHRFNCQFNGKISRNDLADSTFRTIRSSIGFAPNPMFPTEVNFASTQYGT